MSRRGETLAAFACGAARPWSLPVPAWVVTIGGTLAEIKDEIYHFFEGLSGLAGTRLATLFAFSA
jgi:hypothetical protein